MKGDSLPDADHVLRYFGGSKIEGDEVDPAGFSGPSPSVNWLECVIGSKDDQIKRVRRLVRMKCGSTGKLAELNVNGIRGLADHLDVVEDPLPGTDEWPAAPCHAEIDGIPTDQGEQRLIYEALADQICKLHDTVEQRKV